MQRRRTDKPTGEELRLLAENHRLGAQILQLERAAEIDAANLRNCFEDKGALRGSLSRIQRDYAALERAAIAFLRRVILTAQSRDTPERMAYVTEAANELLVVLDMPERVYQDGQYLRLRKE